MLASDSDDWSSLLAASLTGASAVCSPDTLLAEVQSRIETIVLGQEAGSYAQRIQAEFLRELSERVQDVTPVVEE